jgi:hypothetical protein
MPPAMTNIKVGSKSVGDSVRNEATFEGFVIPPINKPHPKQKPLKNSTANGINEGNTFAFAATVQRARVSRLALAMRYSEKMLDVNGAGDMLTDFTPRSDAVCIRVEDAKPAAMNMAETKEVDVKTTEHKNF